VGFLLLFFLGGGVKFFYFEANGIRAHMFYILVIISSPRVCGCVTE